MEKIRERENLIYGNIPNYIDYLEFWTDVENKIMLNNDMLFNITKFLGTIAGRLNRSIRKYWLEIEGISIEYKNVEKIKHLTRHVKNIQIYDSNFRPDIFPKLETITIRQPSFGGISKQSLAEIMQKIQKIKTIKKVLLELNFNLDDILAAYGHTSLFQNLSENDLEKILLFNRHRNILLKYSEFLYLRQFNEVCFYDFPQSDKMINLDLSPNKTYKINNHYALMQSFHTFNRLKIKNKEVPKLVHVPVFNFGTNLEYCNLILIPLFKDLGIEIRLIVIGQPFNSVNLEKKYENQQDIWYESSDTRNGCVYTVPFNYLPNLEELTEQNLHEYLRETIIAEIREEKEEKKEKIENFVEYFKLTDLKEYDELKNPYF